MHPLIPKEIKERNPIINFPHQAAIKRRNPKITLINSFALCGFMCINLRFPVQYPRDSKNKFFEIPVMCDPIPHLQGRLSQFYGAVRRFKELPLPFYSACMA